MAADRVWTVPNVISLIRLGLALMVFVAIELRHDVAALGLFVVAASTDWIDGWYARRYHAVSRLGRILDPLVDKVIVCGAVVLLAAAGSPLAAWMAVVIVVRELVVTAVRAEMERHGRDFSAQFTGKVKMLLQCVAVALVLAARVWPDARIATLSWERAATWVAWAAVVATIWSGLEYVFAARTLFGDGGDGPGG